MVGRPKGIIYNCLRKKTLLNVIYYIYSLRRKKANAIHFANCGVWKENQIGTSRSNIKYWRARPKWHHWDTEKSEGNQIKPKFSGKIARVLLSLLAQTIFKIILKCKLGLIITTSILKNYHAFTPKYFFVINWTKLSPISTLKILSWTD